MNKLIIIGSGPAGLTAAIYAARAQLLPIVIEGMEPGGQLTLTTVIENWPGYPQGVEALKLMSDIREQALRFGAQIKTGEAKEVNLKERPFIVITEGEKLQTECLIIATGASARLLGLESEKSLMGKGVSICATCDGFFFKQKEVLVIGGGDSALEEAIYLSRLASKVTVVHRRDQLRASKIMQERAFAIKNIAFLWNSVVEQIKDEEKGMVTGALIKNVKTEEVHFKPCDGIFVAIGHTPNTSCFKGQIDMNEKEYIVVKDGTATNIPGVFAAGDVTDPTYRQAITAAGMGCMAALDAERYLQTL